MDNYNNLMDSTMEYGNIVYGGAQIQQQPHHQQIPTNHENLELSRQTIIQPHDNNMYHHQPVNETVGVTNENNLMQQAQTNIPPVPVEMVENVQTTIPMVQDTDPQPIQSFQPEIEEPQIPVVSEPPPPVVEENHKIEPDEVEKTDNVPVESEIKPEAVKEETSENVDDKTKIAEATEVPVTPVAAKKKEDEINPNQCRICLSEKNLTDIFTSDDNVRISDKIILVCPAVRIIKNDYLPHVICENCLINLRIAYDFKAQCEQTDKELRKKLKRGKSKSRRPTEFILIDCNEFSDEQSDDDKNPNDDDFHLSGSISEAASSDSSFGIGKRKKPTRSRRRAPARSASSRSRKRASNSGGGGGSTRSSRSKATPAKPSPANSRSTRGSANRAAVSSPIPIENNKRARREIVLIKATEESDDEDDVPLKPATKTRSKPTTPKTENKSPAAASSSEKKEAAKPHSCPYCDKTFNSLTVLRDHKKTHANDKPFLCPGCSKPFKQRSNYNAHITKHKDGDRMTCEKRKKVERPKPVSVEKDKKKKSEFEMSNFGRDLFKCVAPLTTTYWSDSFSD